MNKFYLLVIFICLAIVPLGTFAQTNSGQTLEVQGLALSPFLIETKVEGGKTQKQTIALTNTTSANLPIEISINDFVPVGGGGQAKFLDSTETADSKFSLTSWIKITKQPQFNIPAGAQTTVEFTINPPIDAEPGTHYGGLLFSYRPANLNGTATTVTQKAGVLILVQTGKDDQRGQITSFKAEPSLDFESVNFYLSFYNLGNVHLKPKGDINIYNWFGNEVASVPVNRDATIILPENERLFQSQWKTGWRLGRYTATSVLFFGNPKLEARVTTHFWIIPWQRVLLSLSALIVLVFSIGLLLKRYNRWLIKNAKNTNEL